MFIEKDWNLISPSTNLLSWEDPIVKGHERFNKALSTAVKAC